MMELKMAQSSHPVIVKDYIYRELRLPLYHDGRVGSI